MVKEELNSEEKFFEKTVITERFIKKNKKSIIGVVVAVVLLIGANVVYDMQVEAKVSAVNKSFDKLLSDPKNSSELSTLKNLNANLYDAFIYSQAIASKDIKKLDELKGSKTVIVEDIASYEIAQDSKDIELLDAYTLKQEAIYRDLAQVQSSIILMNDGKTQEAHEKLKLISDNSPLAPISKALLHYGVK
jgi:hypothetical protein